MNSYLQNNTFIGFLDPKNIGKEISFIIIACFVILHYVSSGHFEKMAKKHVFYAWDFVRLFFLAKSTKIVRLGIFSQIGIFWPSLPPVYLPFWVIEKNEC